jgi:2-amino-4-hydroxy-6-hydroxymethyldihydropteridine diphosphokinase
MTHIVIGLGSNLNQPPTQLKAALNALNHLGVIALKAASSYYWTPPLQGGPCKQPSFLNAVAIAKTGASPMTIIKALQQIEREHKKRQRDHWGPRTLDLDLLIYGNTTLKTERLTLPHPEMHKRWFCMFPLYELNPHGFLSEGKTIKEALNTTPYMSMRRIQGKTSFV